MKNNAKGVITVIASCFAYLVFGNTYTWGSINGYYSSYLKNQFHPEIKLTDGYYLTPLIILISNGFVFPGVSFAERFGLRK
jgi:hypothetical protein